MSTWRTAREIPSPFSDDPDYWSTQTVPSGEMFELNPSSDSGSATVGVSFKSAFLDVNGNVVPPGSCTLTMQVLEVDTMTLEDPGAPGSWKTVYVVGRGAPIDPDPSPSSDQFSASGFGGSSAGGGVFIRVTNVTNPPAGATRLVVRAREI